jgi:hypothetical protein
MSINPFTYGKPIDDPERFIGHRREIEQVYSRLLSAFESSSVVGERRMGKTSLLKILGHPTIMSQFNLNPAQYTFIYQDFQFLESGTVPTRFWQRVLKAIRRAVANHPPVVNEIELALKADTIDNYTLDDIFGLIDEEDLYIVLLLDEFENVTRNENFDNDFFAGLRALAIHHNLALITSSRQELVELTHSEQVRSSPFFNIFASIKLRPFNETEATQLIDTYLASAGAKFLLSELTLIFSMAGFHPYFLQMVCHHLFAGYQQKLDDAARRQYVIDKSRAEAKPIFLDYWHNSADAQKILLTVMALRDLERRAGKDTLAEVTGIATAGGSNPEHPGASTMAELEKFYVRSEQVIDDLERRGLVAKAAQAGVYQLFSADLSRLVADEIVGETDDLRGWREWQKDETLVGALPTDIQGLLGNVVHHLNPNYRPALSNWLLEPATAKASIKLLANFLGRYEEYKHASIQPETAAPKPIDTQPMQPAPDAPQGIFARVGQRIGTKPAEAGLGQAIESLDKQQREQMILSLKKQIFTYTGNLNKLMEEAASYGGLSSAPLKMQNEVEEMQLTLANLQEQLAVVE